MHMNTDFGIVKRYFTDRGFGFVTHTFLSGQQEEVFFHIKNIKRAHPELAERLDSDELSETVHFWYETEVTNKGEQVRAIIKPESIHDRIADNLPDFVGKVVSMWMNLGAAVPSWLHDVTIDLVGIDQTSELRLKRAALEEDRRKADEQERKERNAARKIEEAKRQRLIDEQNALRKTQEEDRRKADEQERKERDAARKKEEVKRQRLIDEQNALRKAQEEVEEKEFEQLVVEEKEFEQLVSEMAPLGFTESAQVSAYIVRNKLGYKYKNISGILEMELNGNTWNFKGGFPPRIYARLCQELGLGNRETQAKPGKFESFKELADKHRY